MSIRNAESAIRNWRGPDRGFFVRSPAFRLSRPHGPPWGCAVLDAPASSSPLVLLVAPLLRCDALSWTLPRPHLLSSRRSSAGMPCLGRSPVPPLPWHAEQGAIAGRTPERPRQGIPPQEQGDERGGGRRSVQDRASPRRSGGTREERAPERPRQGIPPRERGDKRREAAQNLMIPFRRSSRAFSSTSSISGVKRHPMSPPSDAFLRQPSSSRRFQYLREGRSQNLMMPFRRSSRAFSSISSISGV
jgi:hypothetical protein